MKWYTIRVKNLLTNEVKEISKELANMREALKEVSKIKRQIALPVQRKKLDRFESKITYVKNTKNERKIHEAQTCWYYQRKM